MINKRSLWFLTLFSLILVLSVYYVTMPSELLLSTNGNYTDKGENKEENPQEPTTTTTGLEESPILVALRVEAEEQMLKEMGELKAILTNAEATVDEKNNAFEKIKLLNATKGEEEKLEQKILDEFKLKSFVKIDGDQIRIVISGSEHNAELANNIMRSIQSNYPSKMYISVQFQK